MTVGIGAADLVGPHAGAAGLRVEADEVDPDPVGFARQPREIDAAADLHGPLQGEAQVRHAAGLGLDAGDVGPAGVVAARRERVDPDRNAGEAEGAVFVGVLVEPDVATVAAGAGATLRLHPRLAGRAAVGQQHHAGDAGGLHLHVEQLLLALLQLEAGVPELLRPAEHAVVGRDVDVDVADRNQAEIEAAGVVDLQRLVAPIATDADLVAGREPAVDRDGAEHMA